MNNAPAILRSLIIFAVCVPLAIFTGYLVTNPLDYSTFAYAGVLGFVLIFPLLLRWHYPLMVFSFSTGITVIFIKGSPGLWLVMVVLSLGISLLDRAMNSEKRFISVPQITWPLVCLLGVVLFTAKLTGGFGLHAYGSEVFGGRKYIYLIVGVLTYFAVTARRIPPERARFFVGLFLLGQVAQFVGDLAPITPSFLDFIYWFFPPTGNLYMVGGSYELGQTRLAGVASAGLAVCFWMMAVYGIRGIFLSGKAWRVPLFLFASGLVFLGGFRSNLIQIAGPFILLFIMERLYRTRLLPIFASIGVVVMILVVPFASQMPFTFQRALSFLPLDWSHDATASAEASSKWRTDMWRDLLPQVPKHLLLGKGYAITMEDYEFMGNDSAFHSVDASQGGLALSGDYHSGPFSVILPFGIWGVVVMLWLFGAGLRVMYCNYRYGDPSLRTINTYLFAYFLFYILFFLFVFGALTNDIGKFAFYLGLSVALNGGVCQPAPQPDPKKEPLVPTRFFPRHRPAFQRFRAGR